MMLRTTCARLVSEHKCATLASSNTHEACVREPPERPPRVCASYKPRSLGKATLHAAHDIMHFVVFIPLLCMISLSWSLHDFTNTHKHISALKYRDENYRGTVLHKLEVCGGRELGFWSAVLDTKTSLSPCDGAWAPVRGELGA